MKTIVLGLAIVGAIAVAVQAQAPRRARTTNADTMVIVGRVVTDSAGDPIRNARVTLSPESEETPVVLTDAAGAFRLTVTIGRYSIVASKTGYADASATLPVAS